MATPAAYLPPPFSETSINSLLLSLSIPLPTSITSLTTSAAYHRLYSLTFPASTLSELLPNPPSHSSPTSLILRISGLHFPCIKTLNECAVLKWLAIHTAIPVPRVLHYDSSLDNALGHEFILMSRAVGQSFDLVRAELSPSSPPSSSTASPSSSPSPSESGYNEHLEAFLEQMVGIISALQKHRWRQIGGLREVPVQISTAINHQVAAAGIQDRVELNEGGGDMVKFTEGPVVDENMWQVPELDRFWGPGQESFKSLNIMGPFPCYVSFLTAQAEKYLYAIQRHESLIAMRSDVAQIEAFMSAMARRRDELNKTRLVLAHRDLHMGNVMYDVSSKRITAVLDWEFAGVVPAQRWDPQRAFLWSGRETDYEEKRALRARVEKACHEKGVTFFEDVEYTGRGQEHMQLAMNFLRAIVEVLPRGQLEKPVDKWREAMLVRMDAVCAG